MKSSQKNYGLLKRLSLIIFAVIFCGCFFSCSSKVTVNSITKTFDEIDRYILLEQTEDAVRLLKKTDKKSLAPNIRLGIYKRYVQLGETKLAANLLKSCLSKNPKDLSVTAVYTSVLLKNGKINEAFELSKKLSGTEYASLYAEALLKKELSGGKKIYFRDYCTDDYSSVYYDAYLGSKDNAWLRNCAVISLINSNLSQAYSYHPQNFSDAEDAYFWALVSYDNKKFVEASEDLKAAKKILLYDESENEKLKLKISAILADAYINLSEEKLAGEERNLIIGGVESFIEKEEAEEKSFDSEIPQTDIFSVIYLNNALWCLAKNDLQGAYNTLKFVVSKYPDYVPGLIAYGNFAYNSSQLKLDDPLTMELRRLGIRSLDMKKFDSLPRIPVEDALEKMNQSLDRFKNYDLYVAMLDLKDKNTKWSSVKARLAEIYHVIELNTLSTNFYPPQIARYAVYSIVLCERTDEAEDLFNKYIKRRYEINPSENFYDEIFRNINKMQTWEIEYAAWFAVQKKSASVAARLYEYIVFNEYIQDSKRIQEISPRATISSMMNLAMIYSSTKRKDDALKLYGKISGRAADNISKAESLYRIGLIYSELKQTEDSEKYLKYALQLNPEHAKARILLTALSK
ncbi:MAG: tetratricopeptide repeat protein [Treponema sp.]|nr:tetratricopeptide repeat protein [Candidatus Treponema merdequi]